MLTKTLKYKLYLENFNDCPSDDFKVVSGEFCRWVSIGNRENNFKPLNLITDPPQRILDNTDKICSGYGLSFFKDEQCAFERYKALYRKQTREHLRALFKIDKGTQIAVVGINQDEGIANEPNSYNGHFTLHEYENVNLANNIRTRINIFEENGAIKEAV